MEGKLLKMLEVPGSIILSGPSGLGKSDMAKAAIKEILGESLELSPDFMQVEPESGVTGVDQIRKMESFLQTYPANGGLKYVLVKEADAMTEQAQNAILKAMEESRHIAFVFTAERGLLRTVESRARKVRFKRPDAARYQEMAGEDINEAVFLYSDRRIGLYKSAMEDLELREEIEKIYHVFHTMRERREIMEVFHAVKERDKRYFYGRFEKREVHGILCMAKELFFSGTEAIGRLYTEKERYLIAGQADRHAYSLERKQYNKNDFFDFIRAMM